MLFFLIVFAADPHLLESVFDSLCQSQRCTRLELLGWSDCDRDALAPSWPFPSSSSDAKDNGKDNVTKNGILPANLVTQLTRLPVESLLFSDAIALSDDAFRTVVHSQTGLRELQLFELDYTKAKCQALIDFAPFCTRLTRLALSVRFLFVYYCLVLCSQNRK